MATLYRGIHPNGDVSYALASSLDEAFEHIDGMGHIARERIEVVDYFRICLTPAQVVTNEAGGPCIVWEVNEEDLDLPESKMQRIVGSAGLAVDDEDDG